MVRHEAAEALGGIGTPEVLPHLKEWMVRDDSPRVVRESCQVAIDMWEVRDLLSRPSAIHCLITLMADLVPSLLSHCDDTSMRIRINSSTPMGSKRCRLSRSERESIPGSKNRIFVGLVSYMYTAVCFGAEIGGRPAGPPTGGEIKEPRAKRGVQSTALPLGCLPSRRLPRAKSSQSLLNRPMHGTSSIVCLYALTNYTSGSLMIVDA
jgi:hypothetical protein